MAAPDNLPGPLRIWSTPLLEGAMSHKTILMLTLGLVPVAVMVLSAWASWLGAQFPSAYVVIVLALGATLTALLVVGLFALSFQSARSGHDERIGNEQDSDEA